MGDHADDLAWQEMSQEEYEYDNEKYPEPDGPNQDEFEFDIDECEYCGNPGKMHIIDGSLYGCGITQRIMCDACFADEMV